MHTDHASDLHGGILFSFRCGLLVHYEFAYLSVCEADNLEVLPMDGSGGSRCHLVREYDCLGALGILNASGRHLSSYSEMNVEAKVLLAIVIF